MLPPSPLERRKDPQRVRAMLIAATATMIAEQGLGRVTVDAVAKAAGVTKGGLFHHFPSKQALIEGVADAMIASADAMIDRLMAEDAEPRGRFTRAFLSGVLEDRAPEADSDDPAAALSSRTLCLAMVSDPTLLQRWTTWFDTRLSRHADTDGTVACAIVRLATDGIWLSSLHNGGAPPSVDPGVRQRLFEMTATCS